MTVALDHLADEVQSILADFYYQTDNSGLFGDPLSGELVAAAIRELLEIWDDAVVAEDLRALLAARHDDDWSKTDNPFYEGARYAKTDTVNPWEFEGDWSAFERSLKTETRYFNKRAEVLLRSIFEGIDQYRTVSGQSVVVRAGPETEITRLYRARVFQTEKELREAMKQPDLEVGPPPSNKAQAGRMNAVGISVFYGASDPDIALAEIRPPVGSKVLIACFEVIPELRLLDLTALDRVCDENGSLFNTAHRLHLKRAQFLRGLGQRLSKPVMPNDEPTEYLVTQAIADFLASAEYAPLPLDGIIYRSVQAGDSSTPESHDPNMSGSPKPGFNVVLFHKAASVSELKDFEEKTEIEVTVEPSPLFRGENDACAERPNVNTKFGVIGPQSPIR